MKVSLIKDRNELTKSENKICDYIEEYMNNTIYMTVTEIANSCGVGEATVTRFCRKLGFRSFLEFKMVMAQEFKISSTNDDILNQEAITEPNSIGSLAKGLYETNMILLENCVKGLDYNQIEEITDVIMNARRVYFIGIGHSGIIAENACYKFMRIGIECNYYRDNDSILIISSLMKKGDVMFIVSNSGSNNDINTAVEMAKKNEIKVIALTSNFISKLGRNSDYLISYVSKETIVKTGTLNSEIQQMYIIDILYNNLLRKNFEYTVINKKNDDADN